MNTPSAIVRLYNELIRVSATTVVIPRIEDVLRRYSEDPSIYYNEELALKFSALQAGLLTRGQGELPGSGPIIPPTFQAPFSF